MNTRRNTAAIAFSGLWISGCFWLATVIEAHPALGQAARIPLFW